MISKLVKVTPVRIGLSLVFVLVVCLNAKLGLNLDFQELSLVGATIVSVVLGETVKPTEL